jgi:hypothetical protein
MTSLATLTTLLLMGSLGCTGVHWDVWIKATPLLQTISHAVDVAFDVEGELSNTVAAHTTLILDFGVVFLVVITADSNGDFDAVPA